MAINISKNTVIYDDSIFRTGFGYPRGSINGMIRFNEVIMDFEYGIDEVWVPLQSIEQHPLEGMIRYNCEIEDFEFLIKDEWIPRCLCKYADYPDEPVETAAPPVTATPDWTCTIPPPDPEWTWWATREPIDGGPVLLEPIPTPGGTCTIPTPDVPWAIGADPSNPPPWCKPEQTLMCGPEKLGITPGPISRPVGPIGTHEPQPVGACCFPDYSCTPNLTYNECAERGGMHWTQDATCTTVTTHGPCVPPPPPLACGSTVTGGDIEIGATKCDLYDLGGWSGEVNVSYDMSWYQDKLIIYMDHVEIANTGFVQHTGEITFYYPGYSSIEICVVGGGPLSASSTVWSYTLSCVSEHDPVEPIPTGSTPIGPTPIGPTPIGPTPVGPTPIGPLPTDPPPTTTGPTPTPTLTLTPTPTLTLTPTPTLTLTPTPTPTPTPTEPEPTLPLYELVVHIMPPAVASLPHIRWVRSGTPGSFESGESVFIPASNYQIAGLDAIDEGWVTPDPVDVQIMAGMPGDKKEIELWYTRQTFSIQVLIHPHEVTSEARWEIRTVSADHVHGEIVEDLTVGTYILDFSSITGWSSPDSVEVELTYGMLDTVVVVEVGYTVKTYKINVTLNPTAVHGEAWCAFDSLFGVYFNGSTAFNVPHGSIDVTFNEIAGWTKPSDKTIYITDGMPDDTYELVETYNAVPYYLEVIILPPDVISTAMWSVEDHTGHHFSNEIKSLYAGNFNVQFSDVPNWVTPDDHAVNLGPGLAFDTRTLTVTYYPDGLTIRVIFTPTGAQAQARWDIMGHAGVYEHNEASSSLDPGNYTIRFHEMENWITPANIETSVFYGLPSSERVITVSCEPRKLELQAIIYPVEVRPFARWYIDGETALLESSEVIELTPNFYQVQATEITDWHAPSSQAANLDPNVSTDRTVVEFTYTEIPVVDIYCDHIEYEGTLETTVLTFYVGADIRYIEFVFECSLRPDRLCIYEGNHPFITGESITNETDPHDLLLYDTGWRTSDMSDGSFAHAYGYMYPGLQLEPPLKKYCVNTTDWTASVKTIVAYGLDEFTIWWLSGPRCYNTAPVCPTNWPPSFRPPGGDPGDGTPDMGEPGPLPDPVVPTTGALTVNSSPSHLPVGTWDINGNTYHYGSTATLSPGTYQIFPNDITGWNTPADKPVTIIAGVHTSETMLYSVVAPTTGTLTVNSSPFGMPTGTWEVDGDVRFYGENVELTPGDYTITPGAVTGWVTPSAESVDITAGEHSTITMEYTEIPETLTGTLTVTKTPAAAPSTYQIDSTTYDYGTTYEFNTGTYTIVPETVSGMTEWEVVTPAPAALTITMVADTDITVNVVYEEVEDDEDGGDTGTGASLGVMRMVGTPATAPTTYQIGSNTYDYDTIYDFGEGTYTIIPETMASGVEWEVIDPPVADLTVTLTTGSLVVVSVAYAEVDDGPSGLGDMGEPDFTPEWPIADAGENSHLLDIFKTTESVTLNDNDFWTPEGSYHPFVELLSVGGVTLDPTDPIQVEQAVQYFKDNDNVDIEALTRYFYGIGYWLALLVSSGSVPSASAKPTFTTAPLQENVSNYYATIPEFYKKQYMFFKSIYVDVNVGALATWESFNDYCDANLSHLDIVERFNIFITYHWKVMTNMLAPDAASVPPGRKHLGEILDRSTSGDYIINNMASLLTYNKHVCQYMTFNEIAEPTGIGGTAWGLNGNNIRLINIEPNGLDFNLTTHAPMAFQGGQFKATDMNYSSDEGTTTWVSTEEWSLAALGVSDPTKSTSFAFSAEAYHNLSYVGVHEAGHTFDYLKGLEIGETFGFSHTDEYKSIANWTWSSTYDKWALSTSDSTARWPSEAAALNATSNVVPEMPPTRYGHYLLQEDFAETWTMYIFNPDALQTWYPCRYRYITTVVQPWIDSLDFIPGQPKANPS